MKLENAINKLTKAGFEVTKVENGYKAICGRQVIEFFRNGRSDEITCIRLRRDTDHDETITDYCAGVFCNTITRAIKLANGARR